MEDKTKARIPQEQTYDNNSHDTTNIVMGRNSVLELLKSDKQIDKVFVSKGQKEGSIMRIIALANEKKLAVVYTENSYLDEMCHNTSHQGIVAVCAARSYCSVEDILAIARSKNEQPFILITDGIEDPYNLGAIIRSANAAGVHGIVIPKRRAAGLTPTATKAAAGAMEHMNVAKVTNITNTIEELKRANVWVFACDTDGDPIYKTDFRGAVALVIGGEDSGVHRLVRESCDGVVSLPMLGQVPSLNASVAAGVAMFEVVRQRNS